MELLLALIAATSLTCAPEPETKTQATDPFAYEYETPPGPKDPDTGQHKGCKDCW